MNICENQKGSNCVIVYRKQKLNWKLREFLNQARIKMASFHLLSSESPAIGADLPTLCQDKFYKMHILMHSL